jgi:hypothetical protein
LTWLGLARSERRLASRRCCVGERAGRARRGGRRTACRLAELGEAAGWECGRQCVAGRGLRWAQRGGFNPGCRRGRADSVSGGYRGYMGAPGKQNRLAGDGGALAQE